MAEECAPRSLGVPSGVEGDLSTRAWVLVAVFAGLLVVVGVWAMWSAEPSEAPGLHAGDVPSPRSPLKTEGGGPRRELRPLFSGEGGVDRVRGPAQASQAVLQGRALSVQGRGFTLDESGVSAALEVRKNEIANCWQAAHTHDPGLAADRTLQIEVAPKDNGRGAAVSWVNSGAEMLDTCVGNALAGLTFEATEPTTLRYPMTFR